MENIGKHQEERHGGNEEATGSLCGTRSTYHFAFVLIGVTTLIVVTLLILWYTAQVVLLVFAGILVGILLRSASDWVSAYTRLPQPWSLGVVLLGLLALTILFVWLLAPEVGNQFSELIRELPRSAERLWDQIRRYGWGRQLTEQAPDSGGLPGNFGDLLRQAAGFLSTTIGAFGSFFVVLFFGLYFAFDPHLYIDGLVRLLPARKRNRARDIIHTLGFTLRWWLVGRLMDMLLVGVLSGLGLWLLGIPLALTLGILAGLLTFIPNIGPIIAAAPAVLLALTDAGAAQALYVALLYTGIQIVESYLLLPMIQQRMVSLPPVLVFTAQLTMGLLFGIVGLLLATPLAAVILVLVKMIYIEDFLGEEIQVDGEPRTGTVL